MPELVEFATTVMTMNSGDLIACGTNHEGLGALQDGETVDIEIQHIGKMTLKVSDPLKRTWERGVYMGVRLDQSRRRQAPPPARHCHPAVVATTPHRHSPHIGARMSAAKSEIRDGMRIDWDAADSNG